MTSFNVGDFVETTKATMGNSPAGFGGHDIGKGRKFEITRVYNDTVIVREPNPRPYAWNSWIVGKDVLKVIPKPTPPPPLDLVPPGKIAPTHPDLEWLWERAEKYAKDHHLCSDYDKMVDALGIPGRLRDITVKHEVNGIQITAKVKARSKAEAEAKVLENLKSK